MSAWVESVGKRAAETPSWPAVIAGSTVLTYGELVLAADQLAPALVGRRWYIVAGDATEVAIAVLSAVRSGAALLLIDAKATAAERERAAVLFRAHGFIESRRAISHIDAPVKEPGGLGLTTSGTNGLPKCVERSWASVTPNAHTFAVALGVGRADVVACTTPAHHSYAVGGGLIAALSVGATFVSLAGRTGPGAVAEAIDAFGVTVLLSVPLLYSWYATGMPVVRPPRLCVSAGVALAEDTRIRWNEGPGWPLTDHYGMSEFGMLTVDGEGVPGSVGRPVEGIELSLGPGMPGEVLVRAEGPAPVLHGPDGQVTLDGAYATGDLGSLDETGRLFLSGRRGETFNVAGNKVSAAEVEAQLRAFPGVRDCAVVGTSGLDGVVRIGACVEAETELEQRQMIAFLRERLAAYKIPDVVMLVYELPRTASGKIRKGAVADMLAESAGLGSS